jgi:hypothetical protein
LGGRSRRIS